MTLLQDAINEIQLEVLQLEEVKQAPEGEKLPESMGAFPFGVTYPRSGQEEFPSAGWVKAMHTVFTEIHVSRVILPAALKLSVPMEEEFITRLRRNPTLSGTVDTIRMPIVYSFGRLDWGTVRDVHLGYRFEITFKIERSVS